VGLGSLNHTWGSAHLVPSASVRRRRMSPSLFGNPDEGTSLEEPELT